MPNTTVPEQSSSGGVTPPGDRQFELLKMEYEKAAERYENLYRAVWQNFSYLSLLSAAILTFGSNQLQMGATVFLGGVPLLFWFWMQFLPLDAYGRDVRLRLRDIETAFNNEYFKAATTKWDEPGQSWWRKLLGEFPDGNPNPPFRMAHFTEFSGKPRSRCMPRYSTRGGILFSATLANEA